MSLYNMLNGFSGNARIALAMLAIKPEDCGRFRDAWIDVGGEKIIIYTRNGGGNRESYEDVTEAFRSHPLFVEDFDDDFDCTYASYVFRVPNDYAFLARELAPKEALPSLKEKTDAAIEAVGESMKNKDEPADKIAALINTLRECVEAEKKEMQ